MQIPVPRPLVWLPDIDHIQYSCVERVGIALQQNPALRGQIGFLLERAVADDGRMIWAAICAHHCWLTDQRGNVVETSCATFTDPQPGIQLVGEPRLRRWIRLRPEQQDHCLRKASANRLRTSAELIYCPGRIAEDQVPSRRYANAWRTLAAKCTADGGWDLEAWQSMEIFLVNVLGGVDLAPDQNAA